MIFFLFRAHTIRMEKHHDYKDTIRKAAGLDEDENERKRERDDFADTEFALEALTLSSAAMPYANSENVTGLLQLQLAAELARKAKDDGKTDEDDGLG